jgi:uncharacterized integral membrane protein (TIGR00698 family)
MEGVYEPIVTPAVERIRPTAALGSGYLLAAGVAISAYVIHRLPFAPFSVTGDAGVRHPISAAILAIVGGMLLRNTTALPTSIRAGCRHIVKKIIPVAIVCTGAGLNLLNVANVGLAAFVITVLCLVIGVGGGYALGRLLGLNSRTSLLLGAGTGICGNSAIVAVAPLVDADDDDVVLSIGTVNLFGLAAMLLWPVLGHRLAFNDESFGIWCGTTIHAVPQVVAAGFAFSTDAGAVATLIKLVRVTLMAPLVFVLAMIHSHRAGAKQSGNGLVIHYARLIPWFVWGFVALSALNTLGFIPTLHFPLREFLSNGSGPAQVSVGSLLTLSGELLLTLALAAIGLDVNIRELVSVGGRAVLAGLGSTILLAVGSMLLITMLL